MFDDFEVRLALILGIVVGAAMVAIIGYFTSTDYEISNASCIDIIIHEDNISKRYSSASKSNKYYIEINNKKYSISSSYYDELKYLVEYEDKLNIVLIVDEEEKDVLGISLAKNMR